MGKNNLSDKTNFYRYTMLPTFRDPSKNYNVSIVYTIYNSLLLIHISLQIKNNK